MRYYNRAGAEVDPIKSLEKAILKLEKHDPAHTETEIANLFPVAQRKLDFGVIAEDVLHAIRSWHRVLAKRPKATLRSTIYSPFGSRNLKSRTSS